MKYDWVHKIEFEKYLYGEFKDMVNLIGIEHTLALFDYFSKQQIYFSEKPLKELKKIYVLKHKHNNPKELARTLNLSEREIYYILKGQEEDEKQEELFNS